MSAVPFCKPLELEAQGLLCFEPTPIIELLAPESHTKQLNLIDTATPAVVKLLLALQVGSRTSPPEGGLSLNDERSTQIMPLHGARHRDSKSDTSSHPGAPACTSEASVRDQYSTDGLM